MLHGFVSRRKLINCNSLCPQHLKICKMVKIPYRDMSSRAVYGGDSYLFRLLVGGSLSKTRGIEKCV